MEDSFWFHLKLLNMGRSWNMKDLGFRKHLSAFEICSLWYLLRTLRALAGFENVLVRAARQQEMDGIFKVSPRCHWKMFWFFSQQIWLLNLRGIHQALSCKPSRNSMFQKKVKLLTTLTSLVLFVQPVLHVIISPGWAMPLIVKNGNGSQRHLGLRLMRNLSFCASP